MLMWWHKTGSGDCPLAVIHGPFLKLTNETLSVLTMAGELHCILWVIRSLIKYRGHASLLAKAYIVPAGSTVSLTTDCEHYWAYSYFTTHVCSCACRMHLDQYVRMKENLRILQQVGSAQHIEQN